MMKRMIFGLCSALASMAMFTTTAIANINCIWFTYQKEMPASAKKLRKF